MVCHTVSGSMNWNNGYSASYYYTTVDPVTWRDLESHCLTSGSIMKSADALMESADLALTELPSDGESWIRVYLNATQGANGERVAIFTGLLQCPQTDWEGRRQSYDAEAYSVLKAANDVLLQRGWYAPAGSNGAAIAADLLRVGPAPVNYEESAPTLSSAIIAENKETNLTMARKILDAIDWTIRIMGDGRINIEPKSTERMAVFDSLDNDIMELSITDRRDWFSCPNVLRVVNGDMTAIARDDDPESIYSTVSRGREIWAEESSPSLNDGEGIEAYSVRRLKELQSPARSVGYDRRYLPDLYPGDIIGIHHPAQRIDGDFRITSQRIELGYGARTSEESEAI